MHPEYAETAFGQLPERTLYQGFQFLVFYLFLRVVRHIVFFRAGEDGIPVAVAYVLMFPILKGLVANGSIQITFNRMEQLQPLSFSPEH